MFDRIRTAMFVMAVGVALTGVSSSAFGQSMDALLDMLVRKGIIDQKELKELKQEIDADIARNLERSNKMKVASWIDYLKWDSDLRLRAEYFDNEDQTNANDRWRYRLRLRVGLEAKFQDWAKIGVRLTSGGEDPVSTNQTLDNTFSNDEIRIDLAYVQLQPPGWTWVEVHGGKMKNPIWQTGISSPLQYDHDVTPEGLAEKFAFKFGDKKQFTFFANFGQFVLDEIGGDSNDPFLLEGQAGLEAKFARVRAKVAGGAYQTFNLRLMGVPSGDQPAGAASPTAQSTSPNRGNAARQPGGAGTTIFYLDDFSVAYGRAEVAVTLSEKPTLGTPTVVTFSGEVINNFASRYENLNSSNQVKSKDQTFGYTGQVAFGGAKKKGEWQVAYQYKYLPADATWDAVTDSDWGLGGTDREGHVIKGAYNVREWWQLGVTAFITDQISSRPGAAHNTRGNVTNDDLLRVQMDTVFKF